MALVVALAACRGVGMERGSAEPHAGLARVYSSHGKHEEARGVCSELLERNADSPVARLALASTHYKAGNFVSAEAEYRELLKYGSESPVVLFNMGQTLRKLGRESEAASALEKLVSMYSAVLPGLCTEARSIISGLSREPHHEDGVFQ
jgi:tetratricopeptide (TPR) repeat protein